MQVSHTPPAVSGQVQGTHPRRAGCCQDPRSETWPKQKPPNQRTFMATFKGEEEGGAKFDQPVRGEGLSFDPLASD